MARGAVSNALLKRGGEKLQKELYERSAGKKDFGEVILVSGYGLSCQVLLFGAMYSYDPKSTRKYKSQEDYYRAVSIIGC